MLGVQLAPAFVGSNAYLALNGGKIDTLVYILIGYGLLQLLYLLRLLPWIGVKGFSVGFWSFSFGLASMASVGIHLYHAQSDLALIGLALFIFASTVIFALVVGTFYLIVKDRFFVKVS